MPMEWMLQVADEVDDALSAVRLFALGWGEEVGVLAAGIIRIQILCPRIRRIDRSRRELSDPALDVHAVRVRVGL